MLFANKYLQKIFYMLNLHQQKLKKEQKMANIKETKALLKEKKERLEKVLELDKKFNAAFYRSGGNICPTKKGLEVAMERNKLKMEIEELEAQSSILGRLKAKKKEKKTQELNNKSTEKTLIKNNKARGRNA